MQLTAIRDLPHINSSQLKQLSLRSRRSKTYDEHEEVAEYMQSLFDEKTKLESVIKEN